MQCCSFAIIRQKVDGFPPTILSSLYRGKIGPYAGRMIYGLTNSKGGVGKTTIAVHLAAWLVKKKRSVIFIDADPQSSASQWIRELKLPIKLERISDPEALIHRLTKIAGDANDIVIDGPAGLSKTTKAIMLRADRVFLPCGPTILDLRAASQAVALLGEAQKARKGPPKGALIPNKLQTRGRLSREMLKDGKRLGIPFLSGLSQRQSFADAAFPARVVWQMGASSLLASLEMQQLMKEMTRG
jgi:chromosome partitioning protein